MTGHAYTARAATSPRTETRGAALTSPRAALAVAGLCVLGLAAVWSVAELVPAVHLKDAVTLYDFTTLGRPKVDSVAELLLRLLEPALFVLWGVALVAFALAEARPRVALAVASVLALAPFTAEQLKPLLAHTHDRVGYMTVGPASWPSGHSTAATALALCAVLVAPAAWRKVVAAIGAVFVIAVGISLLILAWHMPSDVLGGVLVASLWMALAVAALRGYERVRPSRRET
ncbi:MAG TPA: phosphatase PAP2 family protein [Solirubrobacteraceae bacterium]|jgi:membrane-associated phospholipid phosphatase|nr:phosphatase PAP2 family protein [Solirubrobacteraceae bacterium]